MTEPYSFLEVRLLDIFLNFLKDVALVFFSFLIFLLLFLLNVYVHLGVFKTLLTLQFH
jgi:hypothetical protein